MISPHRYAQHKKQELSASVTNECADMVFARLDIEPEFVVRIIGDVPRCIPAKYHRIIREILITSYLNAMCKKATYPLTLVEKHEALKLVLQYNGNVRES
ncbi:MAG: hypothetical protein K2M34_03205 [Alphaproteobacteria bacterium]|nr:hypothetical protein [Alphaproteobacteria bacterium]